MTTRRRSSKTVRLEWDFFKVCQLYSGDVDRRGSLFETRRSAEEYWWAHRAWFLGEWERDRSRNLKAGFVPYGMVLFEPELLPAGFDFDAVERAALGYLADEWFDPSPRLADYWEDGLRDLLDD